MPSGYFYNQSFSLIVPSFVFFFYKNFGSGSGQIGILVRLLDKLGLGFFKGFDLQNRAVSTLRGYFLLKQSLSFDYFFFICLRFYKSCGSGCFDRNWIMTKVRIRFCFFPVGSDPDPTSEHQDPARRRKTLVPRRYFC